jgi:hypothetical protein
MVPGMVGVRTDCPSCKHAGAVVIFSVDSDTRRWELMRVICPTGCVQSEKQVARVNRALGLAETAGVEVWR